VKKDEFAELVLIHQKSMYRLALGILKNNHDAEDALSETIIKAYENLAGLRNENKFKSWIMTILVNVSKNMLAKKIE
jgi:DNA-directed RNA polymerase specialized sigma subunit, sigma24 homolog